MTLPFSARDPSLRERLSALRVDYTRAAVVYTDALMRAVWARSSEDPDIWVQASSLEQEAERLRRGLQHLEAKLAGLQRELGTREDLRAGAGL